MRRGTVGCRACAEFRRKKPGGPTVRPRTDTRVTFPYFTAGKRPGKFSGKANEHRNNQAIAQTTHLTTAPAASASASEVLEAPWSPARTEARRLTNLLPLATQEA